MVSIPVTVEFLHSEAMLQCVSMQRIAEFIMHPTIKDAQINLRLPAKLKSQIDAYARQTGRSKSFVAVEALSEYLAWRIPQIEDLTLALKAADQGDFATEEEVNAAFAKHGV